MNAPRVTPLAIAHAGETAHYLHLRGWTCCHNDCGKICSSLQGMKKHLMKIHGWHWSDF